MRKLEAHLSGSQSRKEEAEEKESVKLYKFSFNPPPIVNQKAHSGEDITTRILQEMFFLESQTN
jgi:hypothetical protein